MRSVATTAILCGLLALAARAGESLSPEAALPLHEGRDAYYPDAAFGKGVFLVAWQSGRTAPGDIREGLKFTGDVAGCRVDKSGKPLDGKPFLVCGAKDLQEQPQAAFGGGVFLVVWQDLRDQKDWDVYAARVSPEGKVLDPQGIAVAAAPQNQALPQVAWDGKAFVIVWQDMRSGRLYEVRGARVSAEGKVLEPQGVSLASDGRCHRYTPAVGSTGDGKSFVLWAGNVTHGRGLVSGGLLVADGKVAKAKAWENTKPGNWSKGHGPGGRANPISMASGPKALLAMWRTDHPSGRGDAFGGSCAAIHGPDGKRVKTLYLNGKGHRIQDPEAAWDGSAFVAAWSVQATKPGKRRGSWRYDRVSVSRVSAEGEVVAGSVQPVSGSFESPAYHPAVASDGKGTTLVAYERHPKTGDVPIKIAFRMLRAK